MHEFIPHIKVAPETFDINFPPGTKVFDRLSNVSYTVSGDDDTLAPEWDDVTAQERFAGATADVGQDPEREVRENLHEVRPSDANGFIASGRVFRGTDTGSILAVSAVIGGALAAALAWFCVRSRQPTDKETNP